MKRFIHFAKGSVLKKALTAGKKIWTKCNEIALNIHTLPDIPLETLAASGRLYLQGEYSDKAKYDDNVWYESPDYWYLYKIARLLGRNDLKEEVFYDLGSGKGRVLCVMSRHPFRKVVGVELFENLCQAAANVKKMRGRRAPVDVQCEDAAAAMLAEGTVFFMFNPFGEATLREVLGNIKLSLADNPRDITIIYYNAVHEPVFKSCGWLEESHFFHTATGRKVSFWQDIKGEMVCNELQMTGVQQ